MSTIGGKGLKNLLYDTKDKNKRLVVTPILDPKGQLDDSSAAIDIRLGTKFIVPQRANVAFIDVNEQDFNKKFSESVETVYIP